MAENRTAAKRYSLKASNGRIDLWVEKCFLVQLDDLRSCHLNEVAVDDDPEPEKDQANLGHQDGKQGVQRVRGVNHQEPDEDQGHGHEQHHDDHHVQNEPWQNETPENTFMNDASFIKNTFKLMILVVGEGRADQENVDENGDAVTDKDANHLDLIEI